MEKSYLIQILNAPIKQTGSFKDNPYNFGGGLKNGGLSDEAMDLLRPIFEFDYMGAAQFEWGAVPEALQKITQNIDSYIAFEIKIPFRYCHYLDRKKVIIKGNGIVYVICNKEWREDVVNRLKYWAKNELVNLKKNYDYNTRELVCLNKSLAIKDDKGPLGWLELDNGYFFFTEKKMFSEICKLFGAKSQLPRSNSCGLKSEELATLSRKD